MLVTKSTICLLLICIIFTAETTCEKPIPKGAKALKGFLKFLDKISPGSSDRIMKCLSKIMTELTEQWKAEMAQS
ncbi:hypothetical protein NPIL_104191 [Nephila pilipes]|uniref:Spider venom protein n=1 Tax=Nephila pilipes TaxID=299642 RepID=A0A8X6QVC1_NEPPI|nr:hypothetical protein NPIL_104191 [Nephila pilipes]